MNKNIRYYVLHIFRNKLGSPDGELGASLRYLSQRYSMPDEKGKACLNDVGTEELAHLEMVGTICNQLIKGVDPKILAREGLAAHYTDHGICWEYP